jgi:hypothetical protein
LNQQAVTAAAVTVEEKIKKCVREREAKERHLRKVNDRIKEVERNKNFNAKLN